MNILIDLLTKIRLNIFSFALNFPVLIILVLIVPCAHRSVLIVPRAHRSVLIVPCSSFHVLIVPVPIINNREIRLAQCTMVKSIGYCVIRDENFDFLINPFEICILAFGGWSTSCYTQFAALLLFLIALGLIFFITM